MINQGDIYFAAVDGGRRPVIVVSKESFNRGRYLSVVPCTSSDDVLFLTASRFPQASLGCLKTVSLRASSLPRLTRTAWKSTQTRSEPSTISRFEALSKQSAMFSIRTASQINLTLLISVRTTE